MLDENRETLSNWFFGKCRIQVAIWCIQIYEVADCAATQTKIQLRKVYLKRNNVDQVKYDQHCNENNDG